jgi:hypothetical protein
MFAAVQTFRYSRRPSFTTVAGRDWLTSGFVANPLMGAVAVVASRTVRVTGHFWFGFVLVGEKQNVAQLSFFGDMGELWIATYCASYRKEIDAL